jgi:hypothetical protein
LAAASLGPLVHLFCARRGLNGDMADTGPHGGGPVRRNSHRTLPAETSTRLARPRAPIRFPVRCSPHPPITASGSCAGTRDLHLESDDRGRPRGGPKVPTVKECAVCVSACFDLSRMQRTLALVEPRLSTPGQPRTSPRLLDSATRLSYSTQLLDSATRLSYKGLLALAAVDTVANTGHGCLLSIASTQVGVLPPGWSTCGARILSS